MDWLPTARNVLIKIPIDAVVGGWLKTNLPKKSKKQVNGLENSVMPKSSRTEHEKAVERIMTPPPPPPPPPKTGGKKRRWSKDEDNLLKELYQENDAQYIADKIGRSIIAVHRHACIIGIKKKCITWSNQEEILQ